MNVEQMKDHAVKLLMASAAGDVEAVRPLINEDFSFQFMQKTESYEADGKEMSTKLNKQTYLSDGVPISKQITQDGMHFTVELILVDGDWVAVFGHSNATSKLNGKPYNNNYCWRMLFSGEGVSEFREYCDTQHAHDVLFEN